VAVAVLPYGKWTSTTVRVERSTRVPIAEPLAVPMIKSPLKPNHKTICHVSR